MRKGSARYEARKGHKISAYKLLLEILKDRRSRPTWEDNIKMD
jgi:hypothetical protein